MKNAGRDKGKSRANRVTSYDVARLANVSQPTVSRAFTPDASITKDKRDRVLAAAKKLRYVPNLVASNLSTARSNMIAVVIGDMSNPFYSECLQIFIEEIQARDKQVLAFSVPEDKDPDDALMKAMRYHTDGIVMTSALLSSEYISLGARLEIPIVTFNRVVETAPVTGVLCDNVGGSRILAERMLAAGARKFLVIRGASQGSTSRQRIDGFCQALDNASILRRKVTEIDGRSTYSGAYDAVTRYFEVTANWPDAIFAVNDIMAIGAMDALTGRFGKSVPGDIMLAGFDGIRDAQYARYGLTTIRQPIQDMVRSTLDILLDGRTTDAPVVIQGHLVKGRTVPSPD